MTNNQLEILEKEIRAEFHIPPFFSSEDLIRQINQSASYLNLLVNDIDFDSDLTARDLLKCRTYYAYNGKVNELQNDFASMILTWQFSKIGDSNDSNI